MKTALDPDLKSKFFCNSKNNNRLREKEVILIDIKFYQKLFIVLVGLSTMLIFPESPIEMANICENYNSRQSCIVW